MATKVEYLAELQNRSVWVGDPKEQELDPATTRGELRLYNVPLLVKLPNGTFQGQQQGFYVYDEGGAGETVYPVNQERKDDPPSQFLTDLRQYAAGQLSAARLKIIIDHADTENEFGLATVYELANNEVSTQRYFVAKDDQDAFYFRKFLG